MANKEKRESTDLVLARVELEEGVVAALLADQRVPPVQLFRGSALQQRGQQRVCLRVAQVKHAARPTAPRRLRGGSALAVRPTHLPIPVET